MKLLLVSILYILHGGRQRHDVLGLLALDRIYPRKR